MLNLQEIKNQFDIEKLDFQALQTEEFGNYFNTLIELTKFMNDLEGNVKTKIEEISKENYEKLDIKTVEVGSYNITFTPESKSKRFDSKAFQKEQPELYEKYLKETNVKGKLTITKRKELKDEN